MKPSFTDQELFDGLGQSPRKRKAVFEHLYNNCFDAVETLVCNNNGTTEDAHDVFQDALIALYEHSRKGSFKLTVNVKAYLYAVSKNIWIDQLRRRKVSHKFQDSLSIQVELETPIHRVLKEEKDSVLSQVMLELKDDCRELLKLSIFEERSNEDIRQHFGYKNAQIASNKKHRCLNYLRSIVEKSEFYSNYLNKGA